jgi:hypothetical protein
MVIGILEARGADVRPLRDPRVADLVQAGRVRVGVGVVAPHWAVKDAATGELKGVAMRWPAHSLRASA